MSEKTEKPMGLPPYYWAKPPVKARPPTRGFVNRQQKQFYLIRVGFALAKIAAAAALVLLIVSRF
ncbi:MAG: hypothetical protein JRN09_07905 [Nitrososphaerota archaeon]|jgi:hypothetical protein|nr:hypothetical protein [Nitrososphaerota archaeon]